MRSKAVCHVYFGNDNDIVERVFFSVPWPTPPEVHPMVGEKVACAAVSPHLYIPPYTEVDSDFRDFRNRCLSRDEEGLFLILQS